MIPVSGLSPPPREEEGVPHEDEKEKKAVHELVTNPRGPMPSPTPGPIIGDIGGVDPCVSV